MPRERDEVKRYIWVALATVTVSLAIVGFTGGAGANLSELVPLDGLDSSAGHG